MLNIKEIEELLINLLKDVKEEECEKCTQTVNAFLNQYKLDEDIEIEKNLIVETPEKKESKNN